MLVVVGVDGRRAQRPVAARRAVGQQGRPAAAVVVDADCDAVDRTPIDGPRQRVTTVRRQGRPAPARNNSSSSSATAAAAGDAWLTALAVDVTRRRSDVTCRHSDVTARQQVRGLVVVVISSSICFVRTHCWSGHAVTRVHYRPSQLRYASNRCWNSAQRKCALIHRTKFRRHSLK